MDRDAGGGQAPMRGGRAKIWSGFRVGEPIDRPAAEWAYVTPRFPHGIKASALASDLNAEEQYETALFWFLSNLKPYDLTTGGPYFGFAGALNTVPLNSSPLNSNIAGFNQGVFAPPRVDAHQALSEEFGRILSAGLLSSLGDQLGPDWMWVTAPSPSPAQAQTQEAVKTAILAALDDLADLVRNLGPGRGQMGHNMPPGALPIAPSERAAALVAITDTRATITVSENLDAARLRQAWASFEVIATRVGAWALKQADTFWSGVSDEGGKALGKALPYAVLLAAVALWGKAGEVGSLIEKLIEHL